MTEKEAARLGTYLARTQRICGSPFWSDSAALAVYDELDKYPIHLVIGALRRCRSEVHGRLSLADILLRIQAQGTA